MKNRKKIHQDLTKKIRKGNRFMGMRLFFIIVVMIEMLVTVGVAWLVAWALQRWFSISYELPLLGWLILLSVVIGGAVSTVLSFAFFGPITRLCKAMQKVSEGDFTIRLEEDQNFPELQEIYTNFNLMAKELEATEILQTDFVSNVSHEFKTPINAIEGYATLLHGDDRLTAEERVVYAEKILFNTRRLSNLVGNILLLSKVDNQSIQTHQTTFRLDEQIRQSIVGLEAEWARKDIEFDVELDSIDYTGSESLLMHVWNNLIGNAIKFDPEAGWIGLRLAQADGCAVFTVEDNGPGIADDALRHVFDRFYQTDSSHKQEGNGLGLALVRQIVALHRGKVTVENRAEGGCRFTVVLPM